jgi:hypothetical protein
VSASIRSERNGGAWLTSSAELAAATARRWAAEYEELSAAWGTRVALDGAALLTERSALSGAVARGQLSAGGACQLLACADGWIAASLPRPSDLELVAPLVEGLADDPWAALREWVGGRRKSQIVERARLLGLAVSAVGGDRDTRACEGARVADRHIGGDRDTRACEGARVADRHIGGDRDTRACEGARVADRSMGEGASPLRWPAAHLPRRPTKQPLVVDFSAMWAGPLCARLLRLAGARVVKVETPDRPDGARLGDPRFYELLNAGHESLVVDPATDGAALAELVRQADIVIEASRPRALAGWGLVAEDAARSGTVWLSITAYGRAQGDRIGFGDDVAAGAGLVEWTDGVPSFVGDAIADPLTGLAAAVAVLRAWGSGQVVDLPMASAAGSVFLTPPVSSIKFRP